MVSKTIGGAKNGGKREILPKAPKFYPADDVPVKAPSAREAASKGIAKLRKSITPGTVLIILSGRFRGRRCVFLKQLPSGLLLVTGPMKVNGVPLRRVNQRYVIGTSTKVDVSKVKADKFSDKYFARDKATKGKGESEFFAEGASKPEIKDERKTDQKTVDAALVPVIEKTPELKKYMKARFSLT